MAAPTRGGHRDPRQVQGQLLPPRLRCPGRQDIAQYLTKGNGGVVNSSRGILLAYKKQPGTAFDEAAYNECVNMKGGHCPCVQPVEATVLRNEVIAPDIRSLTVVWPDRDHAPTQAVLHPCVPKPI